MSGKPWLDAPVRDAELLALDPEITRGADGAIYVRDRHPLPHYPDRITDALAEHAASASDKVFLADRKTGGDWRTITYGQMLERMRRLGQALLDAGLSAERPLAILSGNDIEHASLGLAALHVGIPYSAISPAYALAGGTHSRLRETFAAITPGMVYAADAAAIAPALAEIGSDAVLVGDTAAGGTRALSELLATEPRPAVEAANAAIGPDTIAKFLFTSGSTGSPKAVINTHRMLTSNQAMTREAFTYMKHEPPVVLDWAPWHHTAGGNKVFFMVMTNGGTLYIDDGRPTKADIEKTVRNLREVSPTWYFNVPTGFDALLPFLESDAALRENFFKDLKMLWYAGASLAQHSWDALERLAVETTGSRIVIATGLGATETAPAAIFCTWPQASAGNVGLPVPGVTLKLVPFEDKYDARVKGPNIMPGYWRQPELSAQCFDEEGFYKFGDALVPLDPEDFAQGFRFAGRTAENFKLDTGTWVATGALRMGFIDHFGDTIRDVAIAGADRPYLGAIVFPREAEQANDPKYLALMKDKLVSLAKQATGSSNRIRRLVVSAEPPTMEAGELTDKGSINQRAVLRNREDLVEEIYRGSPRVVDISS